jgi:hypothetical protein
MPRLNFEIEQLVLVEVELQVVVGAQQMAVVAVE